MFDVEKYKVPEVSRATLKKAKADIGIFFSAYKAARGKVGHPREPKITASWSEAPTFSRGNASQVEKIVIRNEEDKAEFQELHALYIRGMASILHPFREDITERRKKTFYKRFVNGLTIYQIALELGYSEDVIGEEINQATIQFANAIGILKQ